jgi:hypothetical protein
MSAIVQPLLLAQRPRMAVQLLVSVLVFACGAYAVNTAPRVYAAMPVTGAAGMREPSVAVSAGAFAAGLAAAVFVFMILKNDFHFVDE